MCIGCRAGWKYKAPGRLGDCPLPGSGCYAAAGVGAAAATGDGEDIMRVCLSFLAVEYMRQENTPERACQLAIDRLLTVVGKARPVLASVIALSADGQVGAATTISQRNPCEYGPAFPLSLIHI